MNKRFEKKSNAFRGGGGGWSGFGHYMHDKTAKLREQVRQEFKPAEVSSIFKGLTFWQTGRTDGVDVRKLVSVNGGQFEQYGFRNVSHIVASNIATSNQQWQKLLNGGSNSRKFYIVTPQWVLDCIEKQRRLPEKEYLPACMQQTFSISKMYHEPPSIPHLSAGALNTPNISTHEQTTHSTSDKGELRVCEFTRLEIITDWALWALSACDTLQTRFGPSIPGQVSLVFKFTNHTIITRNISESDSMLEVLSSLPSTYRSSDIQIIKIASVSSAVEPVRFGSSNFYTPIYPVEKKEDRLMHILLEMKSSTNFSDFVNDAFNMGGLMAVRAVVLDCCLYFAEHKRSDKIIKLLSAIYMSNHQQRIFDQVIHKIQDIFAYHNNGAKLGLPKWFQ